jgi:hypothetical protein
MIVENSKCPEFELAPLHEMEPGVFDWEHCDEKQKEVDVFVITLGLVYNDLKDLFWWHARLKKGAPTKAEITPYVGQFNGMDFHIMRLIGGVYQELMVLLREKKSLLEEKRLKEIIEKLCSADRRTLRQVISDSTDDGYFGMMQNLRSNLTYHYKNPKAIMKGYAEWFENPQSEFEKKAYYSFGPDTQESRFYFCEAAAQGYHRKVEMEFTKKHRMGKDKLIVHMKHLLIALNNIVGNYMNKRVSQAKPHRD